jgi:tetratricopeptide (TPR) repeat protein
MQPFRLHFSPRLLVPAFCLALSAGAVPVRGHGAAPDRLAALAAALERTPDNAGLLVEQADLLVEHGDHAVAWASLERAGKLAPEGLPIERVRARLLLDEGRIVEAVAQLDNAVKRSPDDVPALTLRARAHQAQGRRQASLADYRLACAASSGLAGDLAIEAADAFVAAGQPEEAGGVLKKSLRTAGKVPSILVRLIDIEVSLGRPAAAVEWAEVMKSQAPRPEPWMARRAELLALAGKTEEARAAWIELRDRLAGLPSLERGSPALRPLAERIAKALASLPVPPSAG